METGREGQVASSSLLSFPVCSPFSNTRDYDRNFLLLNSPVAYPRVSFLGIPLVFPSFSIPLSDPSVTLPPPLYPTTCWTRKKDVKDWASNSNCPNPWREERVLWLSPCVFLTVLSPGSQMTWLGWACR